jgi:hypothetical protein
MNANKTHPKIEPGLEGTPQPEKPHALPLPGSRADVDGADEANIAAERRKQSPDDLNEADPDERATRPGDRRSRERNGL